MSWLLTGGCGVALGYAIHWFGGVVRRSRRRGISLARAARVSQPDVRRPKRVSEVA